MKTLNLKSTPESEVISQAVKALRRGGLIIYPTETVYGAGVDATNKAAVKKLSAFKSRPPGKPFSIAVIDQKMAEKYIKLNQTARRLYQQFLPGPLTVISQGRHQVALGVESETGTLGIRIPAYPLVIKIIEALGKPITATSANVTYQKLPYQIDDILGPLSEKKKKLISLIIDARQLPRREPSTVIDTTIDDPIVLRQGEIQLKGRTEVQSRSEADTQNLGKELWQKYQPHQGSRTIIFALQGPMGAGKTQLTKGLARAMGVKQTVTSPTFVLEKEYRTSSTRYQELSTLHHIDAWRMQGSEELAALRFAQKVSDKSVIAIEWADRVVDCIRRHQEEAIIIWVKLAFGQKNNERLISWGVA